MKVIYTVNNYQLGAKIKTTPTDKIISQNRLDKTRTEITYDFDSRRQKDFCDKVLATLMHTAKAVRSQVRA